MDHRQQIIDHHMNYCIHYKVEHEPKLEIRCAAGVDIKGAPRLSGMPCIGGHELEDPCKVCPKWERTKLEDAECEADSMVNHLQKTVLVMAAISPWRKKKPYGKQEIIECPVCKGRLHLTQSSYNGHVHAKCDTENCVSFME